MAATTVSVVLDFIGRGIDKIRNAFSRPLTASQTVANVRRDKEIESMAKSLGLSEKLVRRAKEEEEAAKRAGQGQLALGIAYGLATTKMIGFIHAGLQGTTVGESMAIKFQFLNREIAQLFLPAIVKVDQAMGRMIQKFRSLTGEQQENIGKWIGIGTGMLGVLTIGPKLVSIFGQMGASLKYIAVTNPMLGLLTGIVGLAASSEKGRAALGAWGELISKTLGIVGELIASIAPGVQALGEIFVTAFGVAADVLNATLVPILKGLSTVLQDTGVQIVAVTGLLIWQIPTIHRAITAIKALAVSFTTLKGALTGLGIGALAGLLAFIGGTKEAKENLLETKHLIEQVRRGEVTKEKAKQELGTETRGKEFEEELRYKAAKEALSDPTALDLQDKLHKKVMDRLKQEREQGEKNIDEADKKKERHELLLNKSGREDPREAIRRIQEAGLKTDYAKGTYDKISDSTTFLGQIKKLMEDLVDQGGKNKQLPLLGP